MLLTLSRQELNQDLKMKDKRDWLYWMVCLLHAVTLLGQNNNNKKPLDHTVWGTWNSVEHTQLSPDGQWLTYQLRPGQGNSTVFIKHLSTDQTWTFERASHVQMSYAGRAVLLRQSLDADQDKQNRRNKIKKSDLPQDTLVIFDLNSKQTRRFPGLKNVTFPKKWDGQIAFQAVDTARIKDKQSPLYVYHFDTQHVDTFLSVSQYFFSEKSAHLAFIVKEHADPAQQGLYAVDLQQHATQRIWSSPGEIRGVAWDQLGQQLAFLLNRDTTGAKIIPWELMLWSRGQSSRSIPLHTVEAFNRYGLRLSDYATPYFSEHGRRLYFGMAIPPRLEDTTLLPEERAEVEVWNYQDPLLYTQQEARQNALKEKTYLACYDVDKNVILPLGTPHRPEVLLSAEGNGDYAIALDPLPYQQMIAWEGAEFNDVYVVNMQSGETTLLAKKLENKPLFSPQGKYILWYQDADTTWYAHHLSTRKTSVLANKQLGAFYDEQNDRPDHPASAGLMGWSDGDRQVFLYDAYDIWRLDPLQATPPERLTHGRERRWTYRYIKLDPNEKFINTTLSVLCHLYDDQDKSSGYARINLLDGTHAILRKGAYDYTNNIIKARQAETYVITKEDYQAFPDLLLTDADFIAERRLTQANLQQKNYLWGKAELVQWTSLDGTPLDGILVKPEGFDPQKQYPLIVNFYERSSNTLNNYRPLDPNRSQIVYPFYSSNGYLIFNPDIPYKTGYPGESAFNAIMSGVNHLLAQGFVDRTRIGIQGHSWGGYQIAYLLTRTNLFRCAESGAPVVNMFSAYGGIRWQSGMSRMFQYEKDQSRIGGTIWEYPLRFIENSPIFSLDKISTPVLILHNDNDGAVPWYQGIEFFTAMRRLNKPAWLLNYNGEPHWPVKWPNRVDFQKRMSQFFDHYLLGKPAPKWMTMGIPALEKGLTNGFELSK